MQKLTGKPENDNFAYEVIDQNAVNAENIMAITMYNASGLDKHLEETCLPEGTPYQVYDTGEPKAKNLLVDFYACIFGEHVKAALNRHACGRIIRIRNIGVYIRGVYIAGSTWVFDANTGLFLAEGEIHRAVAHNLNVLFRTLDREVLPKSSGVGGMTIRSLTSDELKDMNSRGLKPKLIN